MTTRPPSFTDRELKTLDILRQNKMSWIVFYVFLFIFVAALAVLIYSLIKCEETLTTLKVALLLIDAIVGWGLKHIVANLFPKRQLNA